MVKKENTEELWVPDSQRFTGVTISWNRSVITEQGSLLTDLILTFQSKLHTKCN